MYKVWYFKVCVQAFLVRLPAIFTSKRNTQDFCSKSLQISKKFFPPICGRSSDLPAGVVGLLHAYGTSMPTVRLLLTL